MKKSLLILSILLTSFYAHATIHIIYVWNGYFQFTPNVVTIELGDTIQWLPLDPPTVTHTITSAVIPEGAASFDQVWELPADTFFQYIPLVPGLYNYVCTPHAVSFNMIGTFMVLDGATATQDAQNTDLLLLVYPNPAAEQIRLNARDKDYVIYDLTGRTFFTGRSIGEKIDVDALSSGLYFIKIIGDRPNVVSFVKL